jgi:gliding motility-associated-like protein
MRTHLLLFAGFILLSIHTCLAQGENNIWYFGTGAGIDFNGGTPVPVSGGNVNVIEGSASVCTKQGTMLFYSDGHTIWDKNNNTMPNGTGILGNGPAVNGQLGSSENGVAIVPFVTDTNKYYLFTLDAFEQYSNTYPGYLRYSVVDRSLNGGLGDVVAGQKNIVLDSFVGECMISVQGSGCFQWLVTHKRGSTEFRVYKIDGGGLELPPVSSFTGNLNLGSSAYFNGGMAISPDNTKLVIGEDNLGGGARGIELCSFNNTTGIVSGAQVMDSNASMAPYAECFSPDATKLYVSSTIALTYQYDLSLLPNMAAVQGSAFPLGLLGGFGALHMGPDGKIYTHTFSLNTLSCIVTPNAPGFGCNWTPVSLPSYGGSNFYYGMGYNVVVDRTDTVLQQVDTTLCLSNPVIINGPSGYTDYMWSDGSTQQGATFSQSTTMWVSMTSGCHTLVDTFHVTAQPTDTSFVSLDTTVCLSSPYTVSAPPGYDTYQWSDGSTGAVYNFNTAGSAWVFAKTACSGVLKTFTVHAAHIDTSVATHDTTVCFQPSIQFTAPSGYDHYTWSNGDTTITSNFNSTVVAWVASAKGCNVAMDSFRLLLTNFNILLPADTSICTGDSIMVTVNTNAVNASYSWSDGSIGANKIVTVPGSYGVTVNENGCIKTDSINVGHRTISVDFGPNVTLCDKDSMQLNASIDGAGAHFLWQDSSTAPTYEITQPGAYWVHVQLASCAATDTINAAYEVCDCQTFVATAFTPNNDGRDDHLAVHVNCNTTGYLFRIFNRWGQQVFESRNTADKWDGNFNGIPADIGTYFYYISYTGPKNKNYFFKGDIVLIR